MINMNNQVTHRVRDSLVTIARVLRRMVLMLSVMIMSFMDSFVTSLRQFCIEKPSLDAQETFIACTVAVLMRGAMRKDEVALIAEYILENSTYVLNDDDSQ